MDLNLQIKPRGDDGLIASYSCPCGCNPRLAYQRGVEHATDGCCCGNEFAVGTDVEAGLKAPQGFHKEVQGFDAPWGERIQAAWTIGPSTDPNAGPQDGHGHGHGHGHDEASGHGNAQATSAGDPSAAAGGTAIDPVCGMTVDTAAARVKGLHARHEETDYFFCGKGCLLEFGDDPARYLDPSYVPSM